MTRINKDNRNDDRVVFLGHVPEGVDREFVIAYFEKLLGKGCILKVKFLLSGGKWHGCGWVTFVSREMAEKAVSLPWMHAEGHAIITKLNRLAAAPAKRAADLLKEHANKRKQFEAECGGDREKANQLFDKGQTIASSSSALDAKEGMEVSKTTSAPVKDLQSLLNKPNKKTETVAKFRKEYDITIVGVDVPPPIFKFEEIQFGDVILSELTRLYVRPTPVQAQTWSILLAGKDCVTIAPTGCGKTLSFVLPAILHSHAQPPTFQGAGPCVLCLSPTRELVEQTRDVFKVYSDGNKVRVGGVFGGSIGEADRLKQATALQRGMDIVVATPGRMTEFIEAKVADLSRVSFLILDDADRMITGTLMDQIAAIAKRTQRDRITAMFSATWAKDVRIFASKLLKRPIHVRVSQSLHTSARPKANPKIYQKVILTHGMAQKDAELLEILRDVQLLDSSRTLIFVNSGTVADSLIKMISRHFEHIGVLHGEATAEQREYAIQTLREQPKSVVVATDVASRGLDIPELVCVVNYEMPTDIHTYVHRIGRTARGTKDGMAFSFFHPVRDIHMARDLVLCMQDAGKAPPPKLIELMPKETKVFNEKDLKKLKNAKKRKAKRKRLGVDDSDEEEEDDDNEGEEGDQDDGEWDDGE